MKRARSATERFRFFCVLLQSYLFICLPEVFVCHFIITFNLNKVLSDVLGCAEKPVAPRQEY